MNVAAPELAPLFRSDAQGDLLAKVLLSPDRSFSIAELARATGVAYASTHREVQRLVRAGLLAEQRVGRTTQMRAVTTSPLYGPLAQLLLLSYGPATIVAHELEGAEGVEQAFIYGSWAARRLGEPGSPPVDVDVVVIGNPSRSVVFEAAERAEKSLGREVNIRVVSPQAWAAETDSFIRTVRSRPLVALDLRGDAS